MSNVDFGLSVNSGETEATFVGPTGFSAKFTKNSAGAWVAPAGFNASLSKGQFTWKLKYNKSGEAYDFDVNTKQLTYHTDRNGIGLTNDWTTSATTYTVKDTSGRFTRVNHTTGSDPKITSIVDSANRTTTYTRNGSGQLTKIDKPGGAVTTMTYDTTGRLATMTVPSAPGTTTITFGYNTAHKITKITQKSTSPTYGNKADVVTNFAYNSGNTVVTNPNGKASTYAYDNQGRVTSTKDPLNRTRSQSWTANSDVQTSTDALGSGSTSGNETRNSYDGLNNATKTELPTGAAASAVYSAGAGCAASGGDTFQVKCSTDASGNTASYDYDTAGNPTKKKDTTAGGTGAVEFERVYDNWDHTICGGAPGQVCSAKDGNGNITRYAYDGMFNLAKVTPPAPQECDDVHVRRALPRHQRHRPARQGHEVRLRRPRPPDGHHVRQRQHAREDVLPERARPVRLRQLRRDQAVRVRHPRPHHPADRCTRRTEPEVHLRRSRQHPHLRGHQRRHDQHLQRSK
ncbi:hypothetical protein [Clavibacter tessellarius]|uniref:hypothetical protein n=1 Tax=Clavibacter tessellarius TaxID=31965 RepID=UPI0039BF7999